MTQTAQLDALQIDALQKLERMVDDAEKHVPSFIKASKATFPTGFSNALLAHNGSLDAAKKLHKAVLGDRWEYAISENAATLYDGGHDYLVDGNNPNDARAWLLAIIRAKIAEMEGE